MSALLYEDAAARLIRESGCTIRDYSSRMTGRAYTRSDDWGIVVPQPRGPVSFAVFAHEVGHQMLHRNNTAPRWQEEIEAWEYALDQFDRLGLPGEGLALVRAARSIRYAARKAFRRSPNPDALAERISTRFPRWNFAVRAALLDSRHVRLHMTAD